MYPASILRSQFNASGTEYEIDSFSRTYCAPLGRALWAVRADVAAYCRRASGDILFCLAFLPAGLVICRLCFAFGFPMSKKGRRKQHHTENQINASIWTVNKINHNEYFQRLLTRLTQHKLEHAFPQSFRAVRSRLSRRAGIRFVSLAARSSCGTSNPVALILNLGLLVRSTFADWSVLGRRLDVQRCAESTSPSRLEFTPLWHGNDLLMPYSQSERVPAYGARAGAV